MARKDKKGIVPILVSVLPGLIAGLSKKNRDEATTKKGGIIRDVGTTIIAGTAGLGYAQAKGMIDCTTLGLPDEYCGLVQGLAIVAGCLMYIFGTGQREKKIDKLKNITLDEFESK